MSAPLDTLLADLLRRVPWGCSAMLIDWEGEMVVSAGGDPRPRGNRPPLEMPLVGAHFAVLLAQLQASLRRLGLGLGGIDEIRLTHDNLELLVHPLAAGYFLLLALAPGHRDAAARAAFELRQTATAMAAEI